MSSHKQGQLYFQYQIDFGNKKMERNTSNEFNTQNNGSFPFFPNVNRRSYSVWKENENGANRGMELLSFVVSEFGQKQDLQQGKKEDGGNITFLGRNQSINLAPHVANNPQIPLQYNNQNANWLSMSQVVPFQPFILQDGKNGTHEFPKNKSWEQKEEEDFLPSEEEEWSCHMEYLLMHVFWR